MWNARRSRTSTQLRDEWNRYVRGWWGYFRLAEARQPVRELERWIRRHIRKCFWLRWHGRRGRLRNLRRLGLTRYRSGCRDKSSWRLAGGRQPAIASGPEQLSPTPVRLSLSIRSCRALKAAGFNRRMRKTARPVVWEGDGAQSPSLDPIDSPKNRRLESRRLAESQTPRGHSVFAYTAESRRRPLLCRAPTTHSTARRAVRVVPKEFTMYTSTAPI